MSPIKFPTPEEIKQWVIETIRHSWHTEYYLERLQVGLTDIQRPHDIVGFGNKLDWPAIRGFAMGNRKEPDTFERYVLPALHFHRQQHHHLSWNTYYPTASTDSMRLGAVDAVCSLIEPRGYQGGCHTWDQINEIAEGNPIHKVAWIQLMALEMQKIEKPNIADIDLAHIPKGISSESREVIQERIYQTTLMLERDHHIAV